MHGADGAMMLFQQSDESRCELLTSLYRASNRQMHLDCDPQHGVEDSLYDDHSSTIL